MGLWDSIRGQARSSPLLSQSRRLVSRGDSPIPIQRRPTGFETILKAEQFSGEEREITDEQMNADLRLFVASMRKATEATNFGLSFEFEGLTFQPKGADKPILSNITGSIESGTLTAIMGGSGAGKSTFVNVLMGKTVNTDGKISINGVQDRIRNYKKIIGYVPQDDIVIPELTVYENILHAARVRLPRSWSEHDIQDHVNAVIDCLELSHVRNSLVGTVGKQTISGGQRKRVSIGMELAAAPMAIFLDEPTSGLDATTASSIMGTLKAIAMIGISVIVVIHQPRMEIFEMIDNLVLLADGYMIYQGPESEVQRYFEKDGFEFPYYLNYGDVVTDIITGHGRPYKQGGDVSKNGLIRAWVLNGSSGQVQPKPANKSLSENSQHNMQAKLKARGASRFKQFFFCLVRALLQQYRLKSSFWFEMGLSFLGGLLVGLAQNGNHGINFVGIYNEPYEVLSSAINFHDVPEMALLTAIGIGLISASPGVKVFSEESLLQRREAEAGHSQIAYFLAKNFATIPRIILCCMHFTIPLLLLSATIMGWMIAFLANLLYFYCIYGLASMVSMIIKRADAPLFATMLSLIVGILSGVAPPLRNVESWHMTWLWRASPGVWISELYFGQMIAPLERLYQVSKAADDVGYHLNWLGLDLGMLVVIGTVYRLIAFGGLYFGKRLRI